MWAASPPIGCERENGDFATALLNEGHSFFASFGNAMRFGSVQGEGCSFLRQFCMGFARSLTCFLKSDTLTKRERLLQFGEMLILMAYFRAIQSNSEQFSACIKGID